MFDEELAALKRNGVPFTDLRAAVPVAIVSKKQFCGSHGFYEVATKFGHWLEIYGGGRVVNGFVRRQFMPTEVVKLGPGLKCAWCQLSGELLNVAVFEDGDYVQILLVPDSMPVYREYGDWDNLRLAPMRECLKFTIDTWLHLNPITL